MRELRIGEAELLGAAQRGRVDGLQRMLSERRLHLVDLAQLVQEPGIDLCQVEDLLHGVAGPESVAKVEYALGVGRAEFLPVGGVIDRLVAAELAAPAEAPRAGLQRTQAFLK